jgi:hypothetical protein
LRVTEQRITDAYEHYFIDPDYCLDAWSRYEYGYTTGAVACIPQRVFHSSCASINAVQGNAARKAKFERDKDVYNERWGLREPIIYEQVKEINKTSSLK